VTASRDSVAAGSGQADQYPTCLNTLMIVLQTHYEHTANPDDLDLVIEIGHELVAMTQLGAARAMYLHNLGNALIDRYHLSDDPADLDEAITSHETALTATSGDSPQFAPYLDDWATAVLYRYRLSHHPDDLATVVDAREALTRMLPARSPEVVVVKYLNNLGLSLLANLDLASEPDGSARDRDIPSCLLNRARDKPGRGAEGGSDMGRLGVGARGLSGFRDGIRIWLGRNRDAVPHAAAGRHKEAWLGTTGDMSVNASYALVRADTASRAVAALERGRSLLLSEALARDRTDLRQLEERGYGQLTARFIQMTEDSGGFPSPEGICDITGFLAAAGSRRLGGQIAGHRPTGMVMVAKR
jgi:hypothetical protein